MLRRTLGVRNAATKPSPRGVVQPRRRLSLDEAKALFPPAQMRLWPRGYLPSPTAAFFLRPEGVALKELLEAREDMRNDRRHELQRDLAMDYQLWCRAAYEGFAAQLSTSEQA